MNFNFMASKHGVCANEMQETLRPAPSSLDEVVNRVEYSKQDWKNLYKMKKESRRGDKKKNIKDNGKTWRRIKPYKPPLDYQGGMIERAAALKKSINRLRGVTKGSVKIDYIENLILYLSILTDCKSWRGIIASTLQYFKTFGDKSLIERASTYLQCDAEFDVNILEHQGGDGPPDWINMLKEGITGWKLFLNNPAFQQLSKLLSISAAVGLCDLSSFNLDFKGMRVFSLEAQKRHVKATDFIDAMVETVMFFIDGGYWALCHGNFDRFLYTDSQIATIEEDYFDLKANAIHVRSGNLKKLTGLDENDYSLKLQKTLERLRFFIKSVQPGFERKQLTNYYSDLKKLEADFNADRTSGKLRMSPYAVYIHGASGVGKSSVAKLLMMQILNSGGFDASDERVVTLNGDDKYMSNYRTHINGIYLDDVGNTLANYVERSPAAKIIELVNNVPAYANMAEADMKGRVSIEPKSIVMTSNVPLRRIGVQYSIEPYSIVRRAAYHIQVKVKKEFCHSDGRLNSSLVPEGLVPDIWIFTVSTPHGEDVIEYTTGHRDVGIVELLNMVNIDAQKHFLHQKRMLDGCDNLSDRLEFCSSCLLPQQVCQCCNIEKQAGDDKRLESDFLDIYDLSDSWDLFFYSHFSHSFVRAIDGGCNWITRNSKNYFADFYNFSKSETQKTIGLVAAFMSVAKFLVPPIFPLYLMYSLVPILIMHKVSHRLHEVYNTYAKYRDIKGNMVKLLKRAREIDKQKLINTCFIIGAVYSCFKIWKSYNRIVTTQGNIIPCSMQDIIDRDSESNPWLNAVPTIMPTTEASKTSVFSDVVNLVAKNIAYMRVIDEPDKIRNSNILFMRSNVALIPQHMWGGRQNMYIEVVKNDPTNISATFKTIISRAHCIDILNTDLSLIYVPSGGSWKDITRFLPEGDIRRCPAMLTHKNKLGEVKYTKAMINPRKNITVVDSKYDGFDYKLDFVTFNGLCMATWVSDTPAPVIIGFHLGGITASTYGVAGTITVSQFNKAFGELSDIPGVLTSKDSGTMLTHQYGITFYEGNDIHVKSPVKFLQQPAQVDYYGQVVGRATYNSIVEPTRISLAVKEVTGVESTWGRPKMYPNWKPFRDNIATISDPAMPFEGDLLTKAVKCYLGSLLTHLKTVRFLWHDIVPLTPMQNLCGIDGKRFIDAIPPNTSLGFPLKGPKSKLMVLLDPEEYDDFQCPKELDTMIWDESLRLELIYLREQRGYPVFKGCLKDEPTSLTKDKVRVFQAAPIAFQLLIRKYFLPVVRYLQLFPTYSEMAVGINAHGPEWDQLAKYVCRYGSDRILAGDYSKYDTRMPAQVTLAAFDVLIRLAQCTGNYTADDISIMRGIASDCCYPVVAMNGDLLQFYGSNPSGNNITVVINCIVNSINLRCAFYKLDPSKIAVFKDKVSLITYGDDFKASVTDDVSWYNHISVADFLLRYDQRMTMPDKVSVPVPYMEDKDVDFLKRKNSFNARTGLIVGILDEGSIFKSLHSVLRSSAITNDEQCAQNIDGALREWFYYGSEIYEYRREQMRRVATKTGLTHMCGELDVDYETRLRLYCDKYKVELLY